jgi:hypothetical protein
MNLKKRYIELYKDGVHTDEIAAILSIDFSDINTFLPFTQKSVRKYIRENAPIFKEVQFERRMNMLRQAGRRKRQKEKLNRNLLKPPKVLGYKEIAAKKGIKLPKDFDENKRHVWL